MSRDLFFGVNVIFFFKCLIKLLFLLHRHTAVSYTHLDVYKRQVLTVLHFWIKSLIDAITHILNWDHDLLLIFQHESRFVVIGSEIKNDNEEDNK